MPNHVHDLRTSIAGTVLGLMLTTGCTRTLQLRAIDAVSSHPLAGVKTTWRQDYGDLLFGVVHHSGPANLPPSGADGIIKLTGVHETWTSSCVFSRPGYVTAYGGYSRGELALALK